MLMAHPFRKGLLALLLFSPLLCAQNGPTITLVANAEGEIPAIAPNTWVEVKGQNLAKAGDSRTWQASDFTGSQMPTALDGVSVTVNGKSAYVYYISPAQINILTPPDALPATAAVQVTRNTVTSAAFPVAAQALSPSFFVFNGGPYVAATHADNSLLGPASLYPGLTTPAKPGETVVLYANGFGPTSTPVVSGSIAAIGKPCGLARGHDRRHRGNGAVRGAGVAGLFQFNVVVPPNAPSGDNAMMATYNGVGSLSGGADHGAGAPRGARVGDFLRRAERQRFLERPAFRAQLRRTPTARSRPSIMRGRSFRASARRG